MTTATELKLPRLVTALPGPKAKQVVEYDANRYRNDPGADLSKPANIYLETSFDDLLLPGNGIYGQGTGAWLQKARAGASAPGCSMSRRNLSKWSPVDKVSGTGLF